MKTLTIRQPWASLIAYGFKDVENRSWQIKYRGRLWVHAALQSAPKAQQQQAQEIFGDELILDRVGVWRSSYAGCILGSVEVIDCVRDSASKWAFDGCWHWVLANPFNLPGPIYVKGRLGLWDWELPKPAAELWPGFDLPKYES